MKMIRSILISTLIPLGVISTAHAQTSYTLNPLNTLGTRGDGSIQPGDSIGTNPQTGNPIAISAPYVNPNSYGVQPGDVNTNLVFVDTHEGSAGSAAFVTNAAIYILDPNSGQIIGALATNGIVGGSYTHVVAGVADDGVVYVCNQTTASTTTGFKIYRWSSTTNFTDPPVVAFTSTFTPSDRLGQTMDVRDAGTNTQIIVGPSSANGTGT